MPPKSLSPRWYEVSVRPPAWMSAPRTRRVTAAALVVLAAAVAVRADPDAEHTSVLVAARDLRPGEVLTAADVTVTSMAVQFVPGGATRDQADAVGHTVAGPVRAGETLTDVRLLGPRLVQAALAIPDARMVPIRPADPAVATVLRAGDSVSVVTVGAPQRGGAESPEPGGAESPELRGAEHSVSQVLATDAIVVAVPAPATGARAAEHLVLLAMGADAATAVAAASLVGALTLTVR